MILIKKILQNRLLILRISNIIGPPSNSKKKLHKTFSDIFFETVKRGLIYENKDTYKDFISIKKFCEIMYILCVFLFYTIADFGKELSDERVEKRGK